MTHICDGMTKDAARPKPFHGAHRLLTRTRNWASAEALFYEFGVPSRPMDDIATSGSYVRPREIQSLAAPAHGPALMASA
jgi:hypothetical protein